MGKEIKGGKGGESQEWGAVGGRWKEVVGGEEEGRQLRGGTGWGSRG